MEQGLTLQPWVDAEHPPPPLLPGCPWGSGNFKGTGFGLSVVCLRTSVLPPPELLHPAVTGCPVGHSGGTRAPPRPGSPCVLLQHQKHRAPTAAVPGAELSYRGGLRRSPGTPEEGGLQF